MKILLAENKNKAKEKNKSKNSQSGFIAAEFLFTFVLVISCGVVVFALTFSLMTIEVSQYITWSAARAYSAGNVSKSASENAARTKFANLAAAFPLLTQGGSNWFSLGLGVVGPSASQGLTGVDVNNRMGDEPRHPWSGVSSSIELKLFKSLQLPFLGPIVENPEAFKFPLRAFLFRNPSQEECKQFIKGKYSVLKNLPDYSNLSTGGDRYDGFENEDNGC